MELAWVMQTALKQRHRIATARYKMPVSMMSELPETHFGTDGAGLGHADGTQAAAPDRDSKVQDASVDDERATGDPLWDRWSWLGSCRRHSSSGTGSRQQGTRCQC